MKIIYLDQFFVSNLNDLPSKTWVEISEFLFRLSKRKKLICPLSFEHYIESAKRKIYDAKRNDEILNKLSGGKIYQIDFYINVEYIKRYIRNEPITNSVYLADAVKNKLNEPEAIEKFREIERNYSKDINTNQEFVNSLRKINQNKFNLNTSSALFKLTAQMPSNDFKERMETLFRNGTIEIRGTKTATGEVPNWIDIILEYLLRHFEFKPPEMVKLYEEIKTNGFKNLPTLNILSQLRAYQSIMDKGINSGDEIDNTRISIGLPASDILFTDKKRKSEIIDLKLHKRYNCLTLSGTEKDLNEFKKELKKM